MVKKQKPLKGYKRIELMLIFQMKRKKRERDYEINEFSAMKVIIIFLMRL